MASKSDYYELLGLKKGASADEIKKAYRKQALDWHPDRHKDDKETAEKKFKEINEAYQVLSDPQKKAAFDQYGHAGPQGFGGGQGNPFAGGGNPFTYTYTQGGENPFGNMGFNDPFDIFESFFGGGSPFGQAGGRRAQIPRYSIVISFMEAVKGVSKEVSIGGKKRKIKIPAGIYEGARINFGDFTLSINVKPDRVFERQDDDIYVTVAIPYSLAVLGGEIKAPTIDGEVKLRVRAGTQSGTMMRLREQGVPRLQGRGNGDEYIRLIVAIPDKLSKTQKSIIEEMRAEEL